MNDWELLQDYTNKGSEAAFRTLVERHLNLVHSVALRQIQQPQLADEISQSVFILLARKASNLKRETLLSGWLFKTTRFVAAHALRAERRRKKREQEAFDMQQLRTDDEVWQRIRPILDEALEHLGTLDRSLILLRFYEGKNHRESGAALGLTEEAARKRSTRALEHLRRRLLRQGAAAPVTTLTAVMIANAVHAAPSGLGPMVTAAITAETAVTSIVATLVQESLSAWRWAKAKMVVSYLLGGGIAIILLSLAVRESGSASTSPKTLNLAGPTPSKNAPEIGQPQKANSIIPNHTTRKPNRDILQFKVVSKDSGEPVPGVTLAVVRWATENKKPTVKKTYDCYTDEQGICALSVSPNLGRLDVGVLSPGWSARFATWTPANGDPIPSEYSLAVERVTNSVGGWLRDANGKAVAKAKIWIEFLGTGDASWRETPRERVGVMLPTPVAISDNDGHWSCSIIPQSNLGFSLEARHPDFPTTPIAGYDFNNAEGEKYKQLWAERLLTVLANGLEIRGRITDEAGKPIVGAALEHKPNEDDARHTKTDADGNFALTKLNTGTFDFAVRAEGYAPEYRELDLKAGLEPVQISLKPGAVLRLQITDPKGLAIPDATVGLEEWGTHRHVLTWHGNSGSDGRIEWRSAPHDDELELYARKDGWCYSRYIRLKADGEEHNVKLVPALNLAGSVTDANTGALIENFKVIPGYGEGRGEQVWERMDSRSGTNGQFKMAFTENRQPWRVCVEAKGYQAFVSDPIPPGFSGKFEIKIKPAQMSDTIHGVVLLPNGSPAVGASVALLTLDYGASLRKSSFQTDGTGSVTNTDFSGSFAFAADPRAHSVAAVSAAGFVKLRVRNFGEPVTLRLQPWGRLEGIVAGVERSLPLENVTLMDSAGFNYHGAVQLDINTYNAKPDSEGRFSFEQVPAGLFSLYINRKIGVPLSCQTEVELRPGETTQAIIGGSGRMVTGKFVQQGGGPVVWPKFGPSVTLHIRNMADNSFPKPPSQNKDEAELWAVDFWQSKEAREYLKANRGYGLIVAPDNSFVAENVLPGTYSLMAFAQGATATQEVTVPEGTDSFDLGIVELVTPKPTPLAKRKATDTD